jgi:hypothetical protein
MSSSLTMLLRAGAGASAGAAAEQQAPMRTSVRCGAAARAGGRCHGPRERPLAAGGTHRRQPPQAACEAALRRGGQ